MFIGRYDYIALKEALGDLNIKINGLRRDIFKELEELKKKEDSKCLGRCDRCNQSCVKCNYSTVDSRSVLARADEAFKFAKSIIAKDKHEE